MNHNPVILTLRRWRPFGSPERRWERLPGCRYQHPTRKLCGKKGGTGETLTCSIAQARGVWSKRTGMMAKCLGPDMLGEGRRSGASHSHECALLMMDDMVARRFRSTELIGDGRSQAGDRSKACTSDRG